MTPDEMRTAFNKKCSQLREKSAAVDSALTTVAKVVHELNDIGIPTTMISHGTTSTEHLFSIIISERSVRYSIADGGYGAMLRNDPISELRAKEEIAMQWPDAEARVREHLLLLAASITVAEETKKKGTVIPEKEKPVDTRNKHPLIHLGGKKTGTP